MPSWPRAGNSSLLEGGGEQATSGGENQEMLSTDAIDVTFSLQPRFFGPSDR